MTGPDHGPKPALMRVQADGRSGTTAFFRNRPFLVELAALLAEGDPPVSRVLFHACSIGAEPYSFALWCLHHAWPAVPRRVEVVAADREQQFLDVARRAVYPASVLETMTEEERGWFEPHAEGVRVPDAARALVRFLPPMSFVDGDPGEDFDAVLIMNALTYVTPEDQHRAILNAGRRSRRALGLTAFHPDTIRADIDDAGFAPLERNLEAIHNGWGDRVRTEPIEPGSPNYSFMLPPYDVAVPDYRYCFCSLFIRPDRGRR